MLFPRLFMALSLFGFVALAGCGDADAPAEMEETPETVEETAPANTIVSVAEDAGLTTLRTALVQSGLDETLSGPGPYTVFAPSDEAFEALLTNLGITAEELLARDDLSQILTYHVLPRQVMSGDLSGEMSVATVEGQDLTVTAADGTVTVTDANGNTATVISADNDASNGVIHVIDGVLLPADGTADAE